MESRQLTIDEVTSSVMLVVKEATSEDRLMFKQWVAECMQDIGPSSFWFKSCDLEVHDGSIRKPKDLTSTIDLALYDSAGKELVFKFIANSPGRIHVDRFSINATSITNTVLTSSVLNFTNIDLSEDVYYFHLGGTSADVLSVDHARISYMAMPVDRQSFPLIPESNLTAYKMFCRWMWSLRQNNNQSFIAQCESSWLMQRNMARGKNKLLDPMRAAEFFKSYLSMVSLPIFNNG